jgi:hypothetical protein
MAEHSSQEIFPSALDSATSVRDSLHRPTADAVTFRADVLPCSHRVRCGPAAEVEMHRKALVGGACNVSCCMMHGGPQEEEELLKVEDTEKVPLCACPCVSLWLRACLCSKEELVSRP